MPRQKKERFEYVPSLGRYRKRVKDADGKYVSIYAKTEAELAAKVEEARQIVEAGLRVKEDPTVENYVAKWLPAVTAEMRDKYKESFTNAVRLHIVPVIGHLHMRDVKPDDAQAVLTALAGKSRSLHSKTLSAMRRMFDNAVKNDLISKNPCDDLKAGGKKTPKKRPLTDAQMQTLLDAVKGTRAETFVMLGLYAGLRREESLGLRWEAVYLDHTPAYIEVRQVVTFPKNAGCQVDEILKTDAANRIIPLCAQLQEYLQSIRQPSGYLIGGEKPLTYSQFSNLWAIVERRQTGVGYYWGTENGKTVKRTFERKLGEKSRGGNYFYTIDFEVTSHTMRHTRATNWIREGVDPKTVQYLLGHTDAAFTLDIYTHVVEKSPAALADAINNPLGLKLQNQVKNEVKSK